jgi:hypothetical protein
LVSLDPVPNNGHPGTTNWEAHESVVKDKYCEVFKDDEDGKTCDVYGNVTIGYEAAWRCVLGTGDRSASSQPIANAGPTQVIECQGNGGANVTLDASLSIDSDCEFLRYAWTGPFGKVSGRNPKVFFSRGTNVISLIVSDDWQDSKAALTHVSVVDTKPPALRVTLTPAEIKADKNQMVRINATVSVADVCGGTPPQVVLTSITSDQPGNGNKALSDIQEADFGTFDRSFLLRAGAPGGRTYTVTYTATDASGNQTQATAAVHVQHSH